MKNTRGVPEAGFRIVEGGYYEFIGPWPAKCVGHSYRVIGFVNLVPQGQELVLVRCLTGPDEGMLFCCTPANFSIRYKPAPESPTAPEGKAFGYKPEEWRNGA